MSRPTVVRPGSRLRFPDAVVGLLVASVGLGPVADVVPRPAADRADVLGTLESYRKALSAVERAIVALGGSEGVEALDAVAFVVEMEVDAVYQSPRPGPPYLGIPVTLEVEAAPGRRWARVATTTTFPDSSFRTLRFVGPQGGAEIDPDSGRVTPVTLAWEDLARDFRRSPQLVIRDAWERREHLRWAGTAIVGEEVSDVVTFPSSGRQQLAVAIDREGRVLRVEFLVDDLLSGDATVVTGFSDYRREGGRWLPGRLWQREAGILVVDGHFRRMTVGGEVRAEAFTPPSSRGPVGGTAQRGDRAAVEREEEKVERLVEGVHLVRRLGGEDYNSLLVDLGDSFAVLEAPLGAAAAAEIAAAAAVLDPGKPIRFLVPTHHHSDHAGGIPYLAATTGAAIMTTPGNVAFFRATTAARRSLGEPMLAPAGPAEVIAVADGEWELDGERTVQLFDVGPNGHADEMLVVWLQESGILFQGDLIRFPDSGPIEPARPQARHLLDLLDRRGLEPSRIVGVHGRVGSLAELREAVASAAP